MNLIDHHFGRDRLCAFELVAGLLFPGTPQEVEVVELAARVVPAAVADDRVVDAVRRLELVHRIGEA